VDDRTDETVTGPEQVAEPPALADVFIHSNAPWVGTGYGTQTGLFGPRIADLGYNVGFSAFYGLQGAKITWPDPRGNGRVYPVYPGGKNSHGNDVVGAHTRHFGADLLIALTDPWVLHPEICQRLPLLMWSPVDHVPVIPKTVEFFARSGALPLAMSRFGQEELQNAGFEDTQYVPHGVDHAVFKPYDRAEARALLGIPEDAFVVGMVAANLGIPSRKGFDEAMLAFAEFNKTVAEGNAVLYLYTRMETPDGEDLPAMCKSLGIRALCGDQYGMALGAPPSVVATTMSAFDVLLNPAQGEGFGVPLLEAQACGTPCITTDFSAMPEVAPSTVGNWCVPGQRTWTPLESWQMIPNVEAIVEALRAAYDESDEQKLERRERVYTHSLEYGADYVTAAYWRPVLEWALLEIAWRKQLMTRHLA